MVFITNQDKEEEYHIIGGCQAPYQLNSVFADTMLDHLSSLRVKSKASMLRLTGLICIIGIASRETEILVKMIENGMNIACLNYYRGSETHHLDVLKKIKAAVKTVNEKIESNCSLGFGLMTRGSAVYTTFRGYLIDLTLEEGDFIELTGDVDYIITENKLRYILVTFPRIHEFLEIDNSIEETVITCLTTKGGTVKGGERIYTPGILIDVPALSQNDESALRFATANDFDFIFASCTKNANTITAMREFLGDNSMLILAQIQTTEAINNIEEIIKVADGVVICRNELTNEISDSEIFLVQKSIICKCNKAGKPVVCTSQLLNSMTKRPRPTNAEVCDVANAVIDGCDCIMLDHETTVGEFPIASVRKASMICKQAESAVWQQQLVDDLGHNVEPPLLAINTIAASAVQVSLQILASAIVVTSTSLKSACMLTEYRPKCPVIVVTRSAKKARQAHMFRGLLPIVYKVEQAKVWEKDLNLRIYFGINFGRKKGFIRQGDPIIVVKCSGSGAGYPNTMEILYVTQKFSHGRGCTC